MYLLYKTTFLRLCHIVRFDISALIVFLLIAYVDFFSEKNTCALCWRFVYSMWHHVGLSLHCNENKIEIYH